MPRPAFFAIIPPMTTFSQRVPSVIDSHVHLWSLDGLENLQELRRHIGLGRMNIATIVNAATGAGNGDALYAKAVGGGLFYAFGGLNHAARLSGGKAATPPLDEQLDRLMAAGCDGMKLLEGKPTPIRDKLPEPLDGPYYAAFFAACERKDVPLLWHVADPEEFWDPATTPEWARRHNWGYGPQHVRKETLYAEVENVLARHPRLRVVFAHLFFLSADLPRLAAFLARHPNVNVDLAPGVEMLFNMSRDPAASRAFFIRHAERIVFGTDIADGNTAAQAAARAGIVRDFLDLDRPFAVPAEADELLEPGGPPRIRGLGLPDEVLARIYAGNFQRLAGQRPRPVDLKQAVEVAREQARIAAQVSGKPADETMAGQAAAALAKL